LAMRPQTSRAMAATIALKSNCFRRAAWARLGRTGALAISRPWIDACHHVLSAILFLLNHSVIQVTGVCKTYGKVVAVNDVSFQLAPLERFLV